MLEGPRVINVKESSPLVLTPEMSVNADVLALTRRIDSLRAAVASGQFEVHLREAYLNDIDSLKEAVMSVRESDATVRAQKLRTYEQVLARREAEYAPSTVSQADPGLGEAWDAFAQAAEFTDRDTVDVTNPEALQHFVAEVDALVQPLFMMGRERLRRDGTPEHVAAFKLLGTLRLRYYHFDQWAQGVARLGEDASSRQQYEAKLNRAYGDIVALTKELRALPLFGNPDTEVVPERVESETQSDISPEVMAVPTDPAVTPETTPPPAAEVEALPSVSPEALLNEARTLALQYQYHPRLRRSTLALLGAIQTYESSHRPETLIDIDKRKMVLAEQAARESVETISFLERFKQLMPRLGQNQKLGFALTAALAGATPQFVDTPKQTPVAEAAVKNFFEESWTSESKPSRYVEVVEINDGVLPQLPNVTDSELITPNTSNDTQFMTVETRAGVPSTAEIETTDAVVAATGITFVEPEPSKPTDTFFSDRATPVAGDPNIIFDTPEVVVTPVTAASEPVTEKIVTNEAIPPEKIKFMVEETKDHYIENYWHSLVDDRASDIPRAEHAKLVNQVLAELYEDTAMQSAMGIEHPDRIYAGRTIIDYTPMLERLRELESFARAGVSVAPESLESVDVAEDTTPVIKTESSALDEIETTQAESVQFDDNRYQQWLQKNFGIEQETNWFSSMFASGFNNKNLLALSVGDVTELSLLSPEELAVELVAQKIDINSFNLLNGLVVSARKAGELPNTIQNDVSVDDFLRQQFTILTQ